MEREIKFRGQLLGSNEWIYGYLVITPTNEHRIHWKPFEGATSNTYHIVKPETVGQFTGLKDKNGKEIFEKNKITSNECEGFVFFDMGCFAVKITKVFDDWWDEGSEPNLYELHNVEVIDEL